MRTKEEIQRQVDGLLAERESLPSHSKFGDPNHEGIDAQISVLQGDLEPNYFWDDEDDENYIYNKAVDAEYWLEGEGDEVDDLFSV